LNELQNVDFITESGNWKKRADKEKEPFNQNGKEIKPNCYEIQNTNKKTLKEVLKCLNGNYVPLWSHFCTEIFSQVLRAGNT